VTRRPGLTPSEAKEVRDLYAGPGKWTVASLAHSFHVSMAIINAALNRTGAYHGSKNMIEDKTLRFAVGPHASGGVGIEFRRPISWIVLSKEEATRMAFLLLEHAGVEIKGVPQTTATPPADHTVHPEPDQTS
jgi:hypothetical protein